MVLVAMAAPDSKAKREGYDCLDLTCSAACATPLREAFQAEIEWATARTCPDNTLPRTSAHLHKGWCTACAGRRSNATAVSLVLGQCQGAR